MVVMNKRLQIINLKKLVGTHADKFDFIAEVDGRLTYDENKRRIVAKLKRRGFKVKSVIKPKITSSKLMSKALSLHMKRKKSSKIVDGSKKAKHTFEARDLTRKQFMLWKKNKSHYDIEGVDSYGTYFKKQNITKTQARKILAELDFDDLI